MADSSFGSGTVGDTLIGLASKRSSDGAQKRDEGSVKETVEQILIAFILAFIFRAFIVEAFVIPTGSMAPTLLGAHMRFVCDDCGYQFDTNYNARQVGDDIIMPSDNRAELYHDQRGNLLGPRLVICPNCGYHLSGSPGGPAYQPLVRFGDRILVLKYLYLFQQPRRWDVVVFKSPVEQRRFDFQQNYIKRLVGRPNESVMVLDGDVYVGPHDAKPEQMVVQSKPADVQQAMWRLVADGDYVPHGADRINQAAWTQPWVNRSGQNGWTQTDPATSKSTPRDWWFKGDQAFSELFLNDTANWTSVKGSIYADWLAYDADRGDGMPGASLNEFNLVGDLRLHFFYERTAGDGPLQIKLSKRGETFTAELSPTGARLLHEDTGGNQAELIKPVAINTKSGQHEIDYSSVDYVVILKIDGREVLKTTPEQYHPNVQQLLEEQANHTTWPGAPAAAIRAGQQEGHVSHLSVWRDVYYRGRNTRNATPQSPMRLGADEYFVMGDNSQVSLDGRLWDEPIDLPYERLKVDAGKVPGRFLIGKAFFVYWPAGFRPFDSAPAITPDFGDMRLIH